MCGSAWGPTVDRRRIIMTPSSLGQAVQSFPFEGVRAPIHVRCCHQEACRLSHRHDQSLSESGPSQYHCSAEVFRFVPLAAIGAACPARPMLPSFARGRRAARRGRRREADTTSALSSWRAPCAVAPADAHHLASTTDTGACLVQIDQHLPASWRLQEMLDAALQTATAPWGTIELVEHVLDARPSLRANRDAALSSSSASRSCRYAITSQVRLVVHNTIPGFLFS